VTEYLTEEAPMLVPRKALPAFAADVVALRDAVARLDKRVARIEKSR
jgi:ubiquinone biosynthesis protein UbiJ